MSLNLGSTSSLDHGNEKLLNAERLAVIKRCEELTDVEADLDRREAVLNEDKENLVENPKLRSVEAKRISNNALSDRINWLLTIGKDQLAEDERKLDADFDKDMKMLRNLRSGLNHVDDPMILKLEEANIQVAKMIGVMQKIVEEGKCPGAEVNVNFRF